MYKILIATASLLLPLIVSGEVLDKSSSFSVEQDSVTGEWTLICESKVSGIDRSLTHNIGLGLVAGIRGVGGITLVKRQIDLLPDERGYSEAIEGVFELDIKKTGRKLTVSIFGIQPFARTGDDFRCQINIGKGPTAENDMLHAVIYEHAVLSSGVPKPEI